MGKKDLENIPNERREPRPDFSSPVPAQKLSPKLQNLVDNEDSLWDEVIDGKAGDTTDSSFRYAAYASRIRTLLVASSRYVAYTSDIGESFRPVAHPTLIKAAYGISWGYLGVDVANEGWKAFKKNQQVLDPVGCALKAAKGKEETPDTSNLKPGKVAAIDDYRAVMVERGIFQGLASMGLPAFTIHSIVRYSGRALRQAKSRPIRVYGPIGLGLAAVPFLPFIFDEPVEEVVSWTFYEAFKAIGGPEAIGNRPAPHGLKILMNQGVKDKAKEL
ncbi:MAG: hypothetical protein M1814_001719 [Vezdaea aestivalis]|nr:MAG: hypothetical protein M1814_001719 [Vezdaea aestivalis]